MAGTGQYDSGIGVAVSSLDSSVYVTGYAQESIGDQPFDDEDDIILLKYDSDGGLVWVRMLGEDEDDRGQAVAVSPDGQSIYVAGYVEDNGLNGQPSVDDEDLVLIKYNAEGVLQWVRQTGSEDDDQGNAVAVSPDGKYIYVAGYAEDEFNGHPHLGGDDIVLLMYDTSGNLLGSYVAGNSSDDDARGIAVSPDGFSVYIAGDSEGSLHGMGASEYQSPFLFQYLPDIPTQAPTVAPTMPPVYEPDNLLSGSCRYSTKKNDFDCRYSEM